MSEERNGEFFENLDRIGSDVDDSFLDQAKSVIRRMPEPAPEIRKDQWDALRLEQAKAEHGKRMLLADRIAAGAGLWLALVLMTVWMAGCQCGQCRLYLESDVLKWLLGTATSTVVGVFLIVLRYLFRR